VIGWVLSQCNAYYEKRNMDQGILHSSLTRVLFGQGPACVVKPDDSITKGICN
jgi:hypothetical protein